MSKESEAFTNIGIDALKTKTHTSISIKLETKTSLEKFRRYERETFDEIITRVVKAAESRRGKKEEA